MRHPRSAHNKSAQNENLPAQDKSTGTKRKRTAAQKKPAGTKKRRLGAPKYTLLPQHNTHSAQESTISAQENTLPAQNNPPVTAVQRQIPRNGLNNSPINALAPELRLSVIQYELQNLQKVAIVPRSMLQRDDAPAAAPSEPSLVFATTSALSKTCHVLHTEYASELASQVTSCKIPSLALHVRDFDFALLTRELFSAFKDSHRAFFNARAGAIAIHLTLTPSFFARGEGERGRVAWLARRDGERLEKKNGLVHWLEWRKAEEEAGRKVFVAYKLERNYEVEGVGDREALRQFMLLFDPLSRGEGEIGGIVHEIIKVFKEIKDLEDLDAEEAEGESEEESKEESVEESEDESEEDPEEEEDSEMSQ